MKKSKKLLSLLLCLALILSVCALGLAACNDTVDYSGPLDKGSVSVEVGRTGNVSLKESGTAKWSIADESIATVKSMVGGKMCAITGVKVGKTTLTAAYGGNKTATIPVTVTERNVLTVKANGEEVKSAEIERDKTLQLSVSSNLGSKKFKWSSSDDSIATVSSKGLVKGVFSGKATITVKVEGDDETYATVQVTVKAPTGTVEYKLLMSSEDGTRAWVEEDQQYSGEEIKEDTFFEWHTRGNWGQPITFQTTPQYSGGTISFKYTSDWNPGLWTGMQVYYKNSTHTVGNTYKLNCKINVKGASLTNPDTQKQETLDKFFVTLNENKIELTQGMNDVEVYYVYTAPYTQGGTSSFDLQMGWEDLSHTNGWFVQNADIEISDISWTDDTATVVDLKTPSFTYADNKVNVNDANTEGVACYRAVFYDNNNKVVGASTFNNGEDFDTDALGKGTYTAKIQAVGKNAHYKDSDESTDLASVVVTTNASYRMTRNGAIDEARNMPGRWAYFHQWYVQVETAKHENDVTTLKFANNDGTFDTLQLYYKNPANVSDKNYKLTVDIELLGDDNGGMVTLCGNEIMLEPGLHTYVVGYNEQNNGNVSFAMIVAIWGQNTSGSHEITEGTLNISNCSWEVINAPTPIEAPKNVTATVADGVATVTFDTIAKGAMKGYEIGIFKNAAASSPVITAKTKTGEAAVNLEYLATGDSYVVKVRAKGDGILYAADSAWSAASAAFSYENPDGETYKLTSDPQASTAAASNRGKWAFWTEWAHDKDSDETLEPVHTDGKLTVSFANNQGSWYNLQLFIAPEDCQAGKTYDVTFTVNVSDALITDDGFQGGETYNPEDHKTDDTTFMITIANQKKQLGVGENTVTVTITGSDPIQILFGTSDDGAYNHISAGVVTISDPVVTAK